MLIEVAWWINIRNS